MNRRRGPIGVLAANRWLRRRLAFHFVVLPVLYVVSVGPACWYTARPFDTSPMVPFPDEMLVYWPLGFAFSHGGPLATVPLDWWMKFGAPPNCNLALPDDPTGKSWTLTGSSEWTITESSD